MKYLDALQQVKSSFVDGSEKCLVSEHISHHFGGSRQLDILDIGIGEGRYVWKVARELQRVGFGTNITGVDPDPESCLVAKKLYPEFTITADRFENYEERGQFDIVMATHSLYYCHQPHQCLDKILRLTKSGGIAAIVLWSDQCTINKLYRPCKECCQFYTGQGLMTIEDVRRYVESFSQSGITDVRLEYFPGRVFLSSWKSAAEMLTSACTVFSRDTDNRPLLQEHVAHVSNLLSHFNDVEQRVNGVLFIEK